MDVLGVSRFAHQIDAGRRAAPDLVQQAGSRAVGKHRVLAGAEAEHLLQQLDALPHRPGVGKRAEVMVLAVEAAAMKSETRKAVPGQHEIWI